MAKLSGLGKGIDAIFLENAIEENTNTGITKLRINQLEAKNDQPRKNFDEAALNSLADSIKEHGVIQPIVVREIFEGRYQIVAGERRYRASKLAGLDEVPVIVIDADELKTSQLALIENIQRENLNPLEEAMAYRSLAENHGMTQDEISKKIGKSRSAIANTLRLLDLPDELLSFVAGGEITAGHARALLSLEDPCDMILLANKIIEKGLSVREAESAAKKINSEQNKPKEKEEKVIVNYCRELEDRMRRLLGRKVVINDKGANKSVTLYFENNEDLDELLTTICGKEFLDEV